MKNKIKVDNNKFFLIFFLFLSSIILVKLLINSNDYNFVDNRMSYKFTMPSLKSIFSGDFQKNVEDASSDQIVKYDLLKLFYSKLSNCLNFGTIFLFNLNNSSRYIKLGNVYLFNNYLVYYATNLKDFSRYSKDDITEINNIVDNTDANVYLYFVETDSVYNFELDKKIDYYSVLYNSLNINFDNFDSFKINNFDDYKKYFYKTDHHWNYKGIDRGYRDIVKLMSLDNSLNNTGVVCFNDAKSSGSKTKAIGDDSFFHDNMCMYKYKFPNFEIDSSKGKLTNYGSSVSELKRLDLISYATIYGGDYAELIFKNNDTNSDKNLLIFSNSYSNGINKLLASHYKNTYVIDGRYYSDFDMIKYIKDNKVDDVLILANSMLFSDNIDW